MRVLKFVLVDIIKVRRSLWAMLLCLLGAFILMRSPSFPVLFAVGYGLFVSMVFASFPYNAESAAETGFLQMLPAKPGEQVLGHFVFALLVVLTGFLLGLGSVWIAHVVVPAVPLLTRTELWSFCPILFGLALVVAGVEDLLLTVFRFDNVRVTQLFRIIPAFLFFFAANSITDNLPAAADSGILLSLGENGGVIFAACLLLFLLCAVVSAGIAVRREQS